MKNLKQKYEVEDHFNNLFSVQNKIQNRNFSYDKVGIKDKKIIKLLNKYKIKNKSCLDVGPGSGRWLNFLKLNQANFLACADISQEVLNLCSEYCEDTQKLNLENQSFKFSDQKFDIIIAFEVLEHLRNPDLYIRELLRISKKNSLIIMSLPNISSLMSRLRLLLGYLPSAILADETHVGFYNQRRLIKLFSEYNQKIFFESTSISLSPINRKSFFKIPSFSILSNFDDSHLFYFYVNK